jgi:YesN/AraC family two-component response regulator
MRGGVVVVWWWWWLSSEMTDEQEHELMATNEQLAQARDTIDELRHKDEQSKALVSDVEAREQALKGKFDQYVKASADKLKFFQAQFDSACTMRDRYKSELGAHAHHHGIRHHFTTSQSAFYRDYACVSDCSVHTA